MGVMTAVAIGGLAISAASATASFVQANKQKKAQSKAEAAAAAAMENARAKLEVNFYDEMAIKKEPYELQREALLAQGAQSIEAGVESERGAAATAGRVQMAQNEAQAGVRTAMGTEMDAIQKLQLGEDSRLRDVGVQLDLGEVEGAQMAAQNAQAAAAQATAQGFSSVESMAQQGLAMAPLYMKQPQQGGGGAPIATKNMSLPQANLTLAPELVGPTNLMTQNNINPYNTPPKPKAKVGPMDFNAMDYNKLEYQGINPFGFNLQDQ